MSQYFVIVKFMTQSLPCHLKTQQILFIFLCLTIEPYCNDLGIFFTHRLHMLLRHLETFNYLLGLLIIVP